MRALQSLLQTPPVSSHLHSNPMRSVGSHFFPLLIFWGARGSVLRLFPAWRSWRHSSSFHPPPLTSPGKGVPSPTWPTSDFPRRLRAGLDQLSSVLSAVVPARDCAKPPRLSHILPPSSVGHEDDILIFTCLTDAFYFPVLKAGGAGGVFIWSPKTPTVVAVITASM